MHFDRGKFYHVYNRSFGHTPLFYSDCNYQYFKSKLHGLKQFCEILAYCLMPDHFHLLIYIRDPDQTDSGVTRQTAQSGQTGINPLSRKIGTILSSYTQAINKQESRSGSLFQPKTKAKEIDTVNQIAIVFHYIHQNPLRAGLAKELESWKHSSFHEYYSQSFELVISMLHINF